jgi:xanthine/CO dehydrogenase XdhC/CoxF family maturation factor
MAHADAVAEKMRASDVLEVLASHGHAPREAARASVLCSRFAYAGCADGKPFYLFGMRDGTAVDRRCVVWGLGTEDLPAHAKSFWPASRNFIAFCRGHADLLENFVDCRNQLSIAWLKRLGFRFDDPQPYGVRGYPFMRFWMEGGFLNV